MHEIFREATFGAAAKLPEFDEYRERGHLLEEELEKAMLMALEDSGVAGAAARSQRDIPHWDPQPGQLDLHVPHESDGTLRYMAELKWCNDNKIFECLYDLLKMVWATEIPGVEATYLVTGAPLRYWEKPVECAAEVFSSGECDVAALIGQHKTWWQKYILEDSSGRPVKAPRVTNIDLVAAADLDLGGTPWQVRTVAVAPVPGEEVPMRDGWPVEQ